jgi:hypothetical protein
MVHPERFGITLDTIPAWIEESEKIIFEQRFDSLKVGIEELEQNKTDGYLMKAMR